jgi:hypothetical protein
MLVFQEHWCSADSTQDIKHFLLKRSPRYHPFNWFEKLNSWRIEGFKNFVVMEGAKVGSHNDGGSFWQPMLILENHQAKWSFRGSTQRVSRLEPQMPGTFLVLNIERSHCVSGRRTTSPWMALCWNPFGSVPKQHDFSLSDVTEAALESFADLLRLTTRL